MSGNERLEQAAAQLRDQQPGLGEAARRVWRRAVRTPRRTSYLRLDGDYVGVRVATVAVRSLLVEALDEALVGASVQKLGLRIENGALSSIDLELVVRLGTYIDDAAHLARTQVLLTLTDLAGAPGVLALPPVSVRVVDVTSGDPRLTTPRDE